MGAHAAYYELDAIGNVRRLRSGDQCGTGFTEADCDLGGYAYTVFGKTLPADEATPAPELDGDPFNQPLRWQGRWYTDLAGGLYDIRNRWWSPEIGAFLQADEFVYLSRTGTLWSWPGQNPVRWRDPSGRDGGYFGLSGTGFLYSLGLGLHGGVFIDYNSTTGDLSFGVYGTVTGMLGLGAYSGASPELGYFANLEDWKGLSVGLGAGVMEVGDVSVNVPFDDPLRFGSIDVGAFGPSIGGYIALLIGYTGVRGYTYNTRTGAVTECK